MFRNLHEIGIPEHLTRVSRSRSPAVPNVTPSVGR